MGSRRRRMDSSIALLSLGGRHLINFTRWCSSNVQYAALVIFLTASPLIFPLTFGPKDSVLYVVPLPLSVHSFSFTGERNAGSP